MVMKSQIKRSTHSNISLVLLRKIPSGKSFNWLVCKYLPTNNQNQCQLHDKRKIKECTLGGSITIKNTMVRKTRTIKIGKKIFYRCLRSRNCGISFKSWHYRYIVCIQLLSNWFFNQSDTIGNSDRSVITVPACLFVHIL